MADAASSPPSAATLEAWEALHRTRRRYTGAALALLLVALAGSFGFANETSAGKFVERLPYVFDYAKDLVPADLLDVPRALLDLSSPHDDGSLKYDYPVGRVPLIGPLYLPEYLHLMLVTLNVAVLATILGGAAGFVAAFAAARNLVPNPWLRGGVRRALEVLRAFPEIVIAGFFVAVLSIGSVPAAIAIALHTAGSLGKQCFEVVENVDMRPVQGLEAVGARWSERVRHGVVPQVLPNFASYALLRLEINVRASTIIGAVGGGGIGEALRLSIGRGHEAKTIAIVILLFCTVVAVDRLSAAVRARLVREGPAVARSSAAVQPSNTPAVLPP